MLSRIKNISWLEIWRPYCGLSLCLQYFCRVSFYSVPSVAVETNLAYLFSLFQLWHVQTLPQFTPLFFTFLTALLPSFCSVSFSLWFAAGPQGRGTCLLTLSPEGTDRNLAITMSKYVHANLPILRGIEGSLLAYRGSEKVCPVLCRTWV